MSQGEIWFFKELLKVYVARVGIAQYKTIALSGGMVETLVITMEEVTVDPFSTTERAWRELENASISLKRFKSRNWEGEVFRIVA